MNTYKVFLTCLNCGNKFDIDAPKGWRGKYFFGPECFVVYDPRNMFNQNLIIECPNCGCTDTIRHDYASTNDYNKKQNTDTKRTGKSKEDDTEHVDFV